MVLNLGLGVKDIKNLYNKEIKEEKFIIKGKKKAKKLTIILPAQEAKAVPPITPILGQAGINAGQFCIFFNKATTDLNEEPFFPLNTEILILGGNKFLLNIKNPSLGLLYKLYKRLYQKIYQDLNWGIFGLLFYKIFLIKNAYKILASRAFFSTLKTLPAGRVRYLYKIFAQNLKKS